MADKKDNEKSSVSLWRIIEQTLSQLNVKLNEIDNRLNRIEIQQSQRTVLDETQIPESLGLLGGRTLSTSGSGALKRLIRLPVCDICGRRLDQEFIICYNCGKKIDEECAVPFHNRNYCLECIKDILPLSKKSFKVLVSIANEVTDIDKISELTKMSREEVRVCIVELSELCLIVKKGFSVFSKFQVTDDGMEALGAFRRVYGKDDDTIQFETDLRKLVGGV